MDTLQISTTGISCPGYKGIKEEGNIKIAPLSNVIPVPAVVTTILYEGGTILKHVDCPYSSIDVNERKVECDRINHMAKLKRPTDSEPVKCPYANLLPFSLTSLLEA